LLNKHGGFISKTCDKTWLNAPIQKEIEAVLRYGKFNYDECAPYLRLEREKTWAESGISLYFSTAGGRQTVDRTSRDYSLTMDEGIAQLLDRYVIAMEKGGIIERNKFVQRGGGLFAVPKTGQLLRVIYDMRPLNKVLCRKTFVLPGLKDIVLGVFPGCYFCKLDLQNGYYLLGIRESERRFFGFKWRNIWWRWRRMPFGFAPAPYIFQKALKWIDLMIRKSGLILYRYLDDFLIIGSREDLLRKVPKLVARLTKMGIRINRKKSVVQPVDEIEYLGFTLTSTTVKVKPESGRKLCVVVRDLMRDYLHKRPITFKAWASVLGKMNYYTPLVPSLGCRMSELYDALPEVSHPREWKYGLAKVNERLLCIMRQMLQQILNAKPFVFDKDYDRVIEAYTDASDKMLGYSILGMNITEKVPFKKENEWNIFMKELYAVRQLVLATPPRTIIHIHIDNAAVFHLMRKMRTRRVWKKWIIEMIDYCMKNRVYILPEWIPTGENCADYPSRVNIRARFTLWQTMRTAGKMHPCTSTMYTQVLEKDYKRNMCFV
jgi:hypothetical protein